MVRCSRDESTVRATQETPAVRGSAAAVRGSPAAVRGSPAAVRGSPDPAHESDRRSPGIAARFGQLRRISSENRLNQQFEKSNEQRGPLEGTHETAQSNSLTGSKQFQKQHWQRPLLTRPFATLWERKILAMRCIRPRSSCWRSISFASRPKTQLALVTR